MARNHLTSPLAAQLVLRVGVTGYRPNRLAGADEALLRTKIRAALELVCNAVQDVRSASGSAYASGLPIVRLISPLAEGADRIVAQEALDMGFELQCPLPFDRAEYEKDFDTPESRAVYHVMLAKATAMLELDGSRETVRREQEPYEAVGRTVLKQCDVLIAIWDGKEAEEKGGTGQIVEEAALLEIPTVWIQSCSPHDACLRVREADGRIQDVGLHQLPTRLRQLLLPPSSPSPDLRQAYFLETQRRWTLGFLFKAFRNLIAAGSPGRLEWRLQDFEDATRAEWQQAWQVSPGFSPTVIEQINARFRSHYAWADKWASWHFRAIARAAGMVNARIDPSYLEAYRKLLTEHEIQSQITYHRENAHRSHTIHHRLHILGYGLFFLTFGACVLHLWFHWPWLTLFAAVFPAFGAAAYGIRSHGEFQRIAERSEAMSQRLQEMADQLRNPDFVPSSHALGKSPRPPPTP